MEDRTAKDRIMEAARARKMIRPRDLASIPGVREHIIRLVRSGELKKISRGLYAPANAQIEGDQDLLEVAKLIPQGVICLLTALRIHEITTQNPFEIWIAIEGTATKPVTPGVPLNVSRFSGRSFSEGIKEIEIGRVKVRVYNPPKTVADCFKFRNKIGLDVALEALRDGWQQRKFTMDELWYYAKVCRMTNVMRPYMESLV